MRYRSGLIILVGLLLSADSSFASAAIRRYALVVGANDGGPGRPTLRYAVSDAKSFARVLEELGGVYPADLVLLNQPSLIELEDALEELRHRIASSGGSPEGGSDSRTEVIVYVSGHANETGLLLGKEIFSYRSLRNWMDLVEADVRIAVLDACASGAITRLKGSRPRSPFLVDASSNMKGHAFLTSSSADEVAQESDHVGGSFFTHYLVSGLRGAADTSGEGKVTLSEAYQFAFHETMGRTSETQAGTQHPSYDINLSGTGDVVMTDLRQTSATLVLKAGMGGRFYIRNAQGQLVVELFKPHERDVALGLEPGEYKVSCEVQPRPLVSAAKLEEGGSVTLAASDFKPTDVQATKLRGGYPGGGAPSDLPFGGLRGRHRIGLSFGIWRYGGSPESPSWGTFNSVNGPGGSLGYAHWFRENLAFTLDFAGHALDVENGFSTQATAVASALAGIRYYPLAPAQVRPYLAVAMGPFIGVGAQTGIGVTNTVSGAIGGQFGGGLDAQVTRSFMIGGRVGYNAMSDFATPIFGKDNFSGWEIAIELGWLFGKGR